jgi:hypothetical protein
MNLGRKVFVIHGRDRRARRELFIFLRSIGLHPIEWVEALAEAGGGAPLISDVLDAVISPNRAFIVLLTPDDVVHLKQEHANEHDSFEELRPGGQARPNVLFEAGMAFGRHAEHTVLVKFGKVKAFSDVDGRYVVRLDNSPQSRKKLAARLRDIGCEVDDKGTDWLSAGDLTPPGTESVLPANRVAASSASRSGQPEFTSNSGRWHIGLENFSTKKKRFGPVVYGEATNHEPGALTFALRATFFDADSTILGTADGLVHDIGSGERRTFELVTTEDVERGTRVHVHVDTCVPA